MFSKKSSAKSASSEPPAPSAKHEHGATLSYKGPSDFCVKKGKWYDCLRPVPGYQGFGNIEPERPAQGAGHSDHRHLKEK